MVGGSRRRRHETFYEAQRRHRRSGWRFSVLSAVAVVLAGFPLRNGDLRIALVIASVHQTFDLVGAALTAPFDPRVRATLRRLGRLALRRRPAGDDPAEARFLADDLAAMASIGEGDSDSESDGGEQEGCAVTALRIPFGMASVAYGLNRIVVDGLLVTPLTTALWRRRRLLAAATALQLTRDPASLAAAFDHIAGHGGPLAAGPWTHLFVVRPGEGRRRAQLAATTVGGGVEVEAPSPPARPRPRPWSLPTIAAGAAFGLLLLVMGGLVLVALGLAMYLTMTFQIVLLGPPVFLVHGLLR